MRGISSASTTVAILLVAPFPGHAAEWTGWRATQIEGVELRENYTTSPCGSGPGTPGVYHYRQFRNVSGNPPSRIAFDVVVQYTNPDRGVVRMADSENLRPGAESMSGGSWVCAVPGSVSISIARPSTAVGGVPNELTFDSSRGALLQAGRDLISQWTRWIERAARGREVAPAGTTFKEYTALLRRMEDRVRRFRESLDQFAGQNLTIVQGDLDRFQSEMSTESQEAERVYGVEVRSLNSGSTPSGRSESVIPPGPPPADIAPAPPAVATAADRDRDMQQALQTFLKSIENLTRPASDPFAYNGVAGKAQSAMINNYEKGKWLETIDHARVWLSYLQRRIEQATNRYDEAADRAHRRDSLAMLATAQAGQKDCANAVTTFTAAGLPTQTAYMASEVVGNIVLSYCLEQLGRWQQAHAALEVARMSLNNFTNSNGRGAVPRLWFTPSSEWVEAALVRVRTHIPQIDTAATGFATLKGTWVWAETSTVPDRREGTLTTHNTQHLRFDGRGGATLTVSTTFTYGRKKPKPPSVTTYALRVSPEGILTMPGNDKSSQIVSQDENKLTIRSGDRVVVLERVPE